MLFFSPREGVLRLGDFEARLSGTCIRFRLSADFYYSRERLGDGQDVFVSYHWVKGAGWKLADKAVYALGSWMMLLGWEGFAKLLLLEADTG